MIFLSVVVCSQITIAKSWSSMIVIDQYLELHFCQTAQGLIFLTLFNKNISY